MVPVDTQAMNTEPLAAQNPVISMRGIDKFFGGVTALEDVDLEAYAGEVLAIVGDLSLIHI